MTPTKNLLAKIKANIEEQREDTFRNHLFSSRNVMYGETTQNSFKLWQKTSWTGTIYYVVEGRISEVGAKTHVELEAKLNSVGRVLRLFLFWLFFAYFIFNILIQEDNSFEFLWKRALIVIVALIVPTVVFQYVYRIGKREILDEVKEIITSS